MSLKWSESVIMKFLDLYKEHDCLWNHRLHTYKNRDARENALKSIVKELEISKLTTSDVKNKIKTIRTMYKKEHSLVQKSKQSGIGMEDIYEPKLFWYKRADAFLNAVTSTTDRTSNLNVMQGEGAESEMSEDTHASASITTINANRSTHKQSKPTNSPPSRKRKIVHDITMAIDKLDKVVQSNNKSESENEFDIFGKHVAAQLKQIPLYDAIICQGQIQSMLRKKRLELIMRQSRYISASPLFSQSSSTPSPTRSNMYDDHWSSSIATDYNKEQCEEDVKQHSYK